MSKLDNYEGEDETVLAYELGEEEEEVVLDFLSIDAESVRNRVEALESKVSPYIDLLRTIDEAREAKDLDRQDIIEKIKAIGNPYIRSALMFRFLYGYFVLMITSNELRDLSHTMQEYLKELQIELTSKEMSYDQIWELVAFIKELKDSIDPELRVTLIDDEYYVAGQLGSVDTTLGLLGKLGFKPTKQNVMYPSMIDIRLRKGVRDEYKPHYFYFTDFFIKYQGVEVWNGLFAILELLVKGKVPTYIDRIGAYKRKIEETEEARRIAIAAAASAEA